MHTQFVQNPMRFAFDILIIIIYSKCKGNQHDMYLAIG